MEQGIDNTALGRLVHVLAKYTALAGGAVLVAFMLVTVASIAGRALLPLNDLFGARIFGPIPGDYELAEAGMAFAVFAFLGWCTLTRGHAVVSLVTDRLPLRLNAAIELLMDTLMLAAAIFIAWRHGAGMLDKLGYGETSFILRFPIWWAYAAGMIGAAVWVLVLFYCVARSAQNAAAARPERPEAEIADE
jgi:TRAP-type C4-dicarboxylate transport system permease small subunit